MWGCGGACAELCVGLGAGLREERVRGSVWGCAPRPVGLHRLRLVLPVRAGATAGGSRRRCPAVGGGEGGKERGSTEARQEAGGSARGPRERSGEGAAGGCPPSGTVRGGDEGRAARPRSGGGRGLQIAAGQRRGRCPGGIPGEERIPSSPSRCPVCPAPSACSAEPPGRLQAVSNTGDC